MEGGGNKLYCNIVGASNMGMEESLATTTTRGSEITTDGNVGTNVVTESGQGAFFCKRKRGRPRKYDSNGNFIRRPSVQSLSPPPSLLIHQRGRQQPLGSPHHQLYAMGDMHAETTGKEFTPYVIHVSIGEDIAEKILVAFQAGPRCISILSAIGMVYDVVIRQPDSSSYAHLLKYEGIFEILRLSGSFNISEDGKVETGGLSVLLSRNDDHVIGGALGGSLLAASPVQMVVGSFIPTRKQKHPKKRHQCGLRLPVAPHASGDPEVAILENPREGRSISFKLLHVNQCQSLTGRQVILSMNQEQATLYPHGI
ncbi:hypothetical protein OSB04_029218 [Centaurea solstitialis]|uniref:AT-hook motif nuclear-localized protein n=1 Tax=Centaurea solstitialis TaxID=347529 RepID=A0AA38T0T0_9ASTR|nr:hypothetical protein OSB04_029218 [Centaurea solstitialis]